MLSIKGLSDRVMLVILDGFGLTDKDFKNAVFHAHTPNLEYLFQNFPFTTIEPGGENVGLPKGVTGNSEVGHMNLGAGRPVRQDLVRINEVIENGSLGELAQFLELIDYAQKHTKRIHLMGLLSDGGVHSHINHLKAFLDLFKKTPELKIFLHAFMDGRDTPRDNGKKYLDEIIHHGGFTFASMQGRSIGMDRDRRWEKIKLAYDTFIGKGQRSDLTPQAYLAEEYKQGRFDEFVTPVLFSEAGKIEQGDAIFFFNYRPDRAIQLALCFNWNKFNFFERPVLPGHYLCLTPYIPDEVSLPILFDKEKIAGPLSELLSKLGKKQFKIAETEKYAHVTFFFNGGQKEPYPMETHYLVPSPKEVATYDLKPEMSAHAITDRLLTAMEDRDTSFYLVNYANCDMVGHTGNYPAAIKAVETVDACVGKLMEKCKEQGIAMFLTADHGNADQMAYEDGSPHTSHSNNPVPFALYHPRFIDKKINIKAHYLSGEGALKDVAPTLLYCMGLEIPEIMTGKPIFI
jgi:2,3-bisphosphoglycerate-independent phosphoglycerate mutase